MKHLLLPFGIALTLCVTGCSGPEVLMGDERHRLEIPEHFIVDPERTRWVDAADGLDENEGVLVKIPRDEWSRGSWILRSKASPFLLMHSAASSTARAPGPEVDGGPTALIEPSSAPGLQRVHHGSSPRSSSAWTLIRRPASSDAMKVDSAISESVAQCTRYVAKPDVRCTGTVRVGLYDVDISGPELLFTDMEALKRDLSGLLCRWEISDDGRCGAAVER